MLSLTRVVALSLLFGGVLYLLKCTPAVCEPDASTGIKGARVAILPVLERSGREGKEKAEFVEAGMVELQKGFHKEGLTVVDGAEIDAACKELQMDPADPDHRIADRFGPLARRLSVRFIASAAVMHVDSEFKRGLFVSRKQGTATIELRIYDAETGAYAIRGEYRATKKGRTFAPGISRSRSMRTGAIADAVEKGINAFARHFAPPEPTAGK